MIARRTYNSELIKSVLGHPEIVATIGEEGFDFADFEPDIWGECWLAMKVGDELVGLYNLHTHNSVTVAIHAHVLPEHRAEHSQDTGRAALQWIIDNTEYQKVVAQVPEIYENVKKFTCSFGFKVEGINRKSYQKDGEIVDQWLLGITRDEIEAYLNVQTS